MMPGETLGTVVQVAVALAGFTGVVAVFGTNPVHKWSALNRLRLKLLLIMSAIPVALCLIAIVLLAAGLRESMIWRLVSALAAFAFIAAAVIAQRGMSRVPGKEIDRSGGSRLIFYTTGMGGVASILLLVYNAALRCEFWPFVTAIVVSMLAALLQFVRLVLLRPDGAGE